ncbi:acyl-CoA dehydrogenase [Nocardioides yefusunii]|uniref:Acyl-CoA dehydrogenase n=1 Tax=Nocardioides yefusunii TaxID=2500546 RepID=A0ABW1QY29_9ACTN|nr:acyl-CoA dehydrogenase [Nocardioides yefusunii]
MSDENAAVRPTDTAADAPAATTPRPDVASLTALLDGEYAAVRQRVREVLPEHADLLAEAETLPKEAFRERVKETVLDLTADGHTVLGLPTAYGGGGDIGASIAAFETLANGDLSVMTKVGVQFGLFGGAILQLGTAKHHDRWMADIVGGRLLGCFAMTETGHGSDVASVGTVARYDAATDEFVVTTPDDASRKDYIGNAAAHGELAVVFAQLEVNGERHGVHALVVPIRVDGQPAPGVRIEDCGHKLGLNGVDNGRLWFDDVRVPRENLLDRFASVSAEGVYSSPIESQGRRFFTMLGTLVQGRVSVGGAGVTASKVALTIAVNYADRRRQFEAGEKGVEQLLLDYGMHQRRLLPLIARTYALNFAQEVLVGNLHSVFTASANGQEVDEKDRKLLESRAAGTKALATWHATRTIQECREACGGAGYLSVNRFAALKADTDVFTTFEGDNHVLLQLVAKGLLTDYSGGFSNLDQFGMVKFVAGLAVDTVVERTAARRLLERVKDVLPGGKEDHWDVEAGILDTDYQLAMFRFREEHLVETAARRIQGGVKAGRNPGEVFSDVQDHVLATARAHVERLVFEAFVDKVKAMEDGDERYAMELLLDLHALSTIEADRAWFIEHGRLSTPRSKQITVEVNNLCRKVRPIATDLVDAFAVPEELLRAEALRS